MLKVGSGSLPPEKMLEAAPSKALENAALQ